MLLHALLAVLSLSRTTTTGAFTPYTPTANWEYYLEANHLVNRGATSVTWPACPFRFLSFPSTCDALNLWSSVGTDQLFKLVPGSASGTFAIEAGCGKPLGYTTNCEDQEVKLGATPLQHDFIFAQDAQTFEWTIEAVGRKSCAYRWVSFPATSCSATQAVPITLEGGGGGSLTSTFRIHAANGPATRVHATNTDRPCADPFAWNADGSYHLVCTGGHMAYSTLAGALGTNATFQTSGAALPPSPPQPQWASSSNRWAPETTTLPSSDGSAYLTLQGHFFRHVLTPGTAAFRGGFGLKMAAI